MMRALHVFATPPCRYGITNTFANTSGVVGPIIVGHMLGKKPTEYDWSHVFFLTAAIQALGGVVWVICASGSDQGFPLHDAGRVAATGTQGSKRDRKRDDATGSSCDHGGVA